MSVVQTKGIERGHVAARRRHRLVLAGLAAVLTAGTVAGVPSGRATLEPKPPPGPIADRIELMEAVGKNAKKVAEAMKANQPADAAAPARAIAASMERFVQLFPAQSTDPASRAKPEIWTDKAKFDQLAKLLETNANAFADVATKGGDAAAAVKPMWAQCKACHDAFRTPKEGE